MIMAVAATPAHLFRPCFLLSCYGFRRLHLGLPTATGRLIRHNFRGRISSSLCASSVIDNGGRSKTSAKRRRMQCYCTNQSTDSSGATGVVSIGSDSRINGKEEEGTGDSEKVTKEVGNTLDIRVGRIVKVWRHEEADSLYVEEVDVGEPEPRTICSGLVNYIPIHLLQDRNVVVLANLKPRNMRGVKSFGMLMAASDTMHEKVELLVPPEGAVPGERVWFGSVEDKENLPDVASPNQVQKKKIWETVQPHLRTDASCVAMLGPHQMQTSAGVIICESLTEAKIS